MLATVGTAEVAVAEVAAAAAEAAVASVAAEFASANKKLLLEISSMKNSPQPSRSRFSLLSRKSKGRE